MNSRKYSYLLPGPTLAWPMTPMAQRKTHLADAQRDKGHRAAVDVDGVGADGADGDAEKSEVVDEVGHRLLELDGRDVSGTPLGARHGGQGGPGGLNDHTGNEH